MDKGSGKVAAAKWEWLPRAMPGVARLIAERRRSLGDVHVNECWRRGVVQGEPGWFFAREGPLAVGTPWAEFADVAWWQATASQSMLMMKEPHGTH